MGKGLAGMTGTGPDSLTAPFNAREDVGRRPVARPLAVNNRAGRILRSNRAAGLSSAGRSSQPALACPSRA